MTLEELLSVTDDNGRAVITCQGATLASYDGRNAIPEKLNAARVVSVAGGADGLRVEVIPAEGCGLAGAGAVYRVLVDGEDFDPFCPSAAFCELADAEYQAACLTEVDGIEPDRIEIVREAARW